MATAALSTKAIGSIVKIKENNVLTNFIVLNHGYPASGRTLVVREDIHSKRVYDASNENDFSVSDTKTWLNDSYINLIDPLIRSQIIAVPIQYNKQYSIKTISVKIFLLSGKELGFSYEEQPNDGTSLSYFSTDARRIAKYSGTATIYVTRTGYTGNPKDTISVKTNGTLLATNDAGLETGIRPAFTLPSTIKVDDSGAIITNTAPTAPSSISVPESVCGGKTLAISWGASTDADNNLSGYALERSVNGGSFSQIKTTSSTVRSYTDTITFGWNTVAYRVRAYDTQSAYSGYATSPTRTVVNNNAPTISGSNGELGTKNEAFSVPYTVNDQDGGTVSVVETLDGTVWRSYNANLGAETSFTITADPFLKVLNGEHTITITATDSLGATATRTWTFSKSVKTVAFRLANPSPADTMPVKCITNIEGSFPNGSILTIEVCNNGLDESPVWEDVTQKTLDHQKYFFTNKGKTAEQWAFDIRVRLQRGTATSTCFISSLGGNFE